MRDDELELRPLAGTDRAALEAIFAEPEVKRWWPVPGYRADSGWMVDVEGAPAGWLEYHEEDHEWYPSVAFDIALSTPLHGRGYGRRALSLAIDHFVARGHHRFTLDPNAENVRAIRSYSALGFETVGTMRAYERNPAGGWNDALLMELIRL
ncbi:MAG TPA: GNAT family N-acetyltransferase [Solirubrobacteraceae bacterium]|jgi:aminoglycoside 6'-N-acetyltransferase